MEKKQIRKIFLFQFKLGRKAAETAHDLNEPFGPGTTTERTAQWWFKKFRGGDESLEDDERSGRPSDVDNDQLRALVEANPRTTVRELASELDVTYTTISNQRDWKDQKTWSMGASRIERQPKETPLWSVIFPSFTQQERLVSRPDCDLRWKVGSLRQPAILSSVVRRRRNSTTLHEARVAPKEGHADCLVVCDRSYPLQFFECRRNHYGVEVLSTNGWNASETSTTTPSISE